MLNAMTEPLHPAVGTYAWAFNTPPEKIASGEAIVLRVEAVYAHRVVGITSRLHFFRATLGEFTRATPATAHDWQRAVLASELKAIRGG